LNVENKGRQLKLKLDEIEKGWNGRV